jgi:hypothetical protein
MSGHLAMRDQILDPVEDPAAPGFDHIPYLVRSGNAIGRNDL